MRGAGDGVEAALHDPVVQRVIANGERRAADRVEAVASIERDRARRARPHAQPQAVGTASRGFVAGHREQTRAQPATARLAAQVTRNLTNIFGGPHDTVNAIAYQLLAGVRYPVTPTIAVDVDYKFLGTGETTFLSTNVGGDKIHSNYRTHNIVASLVYRFGPGTP